VLTTPKQNEIIHRLLVFLDQEPDGNPEIIIPAFLDREGEGLDGEDRDRLVRLAYEVAWHRAETLQKEARAGLEQADHVELLCQVRRQSQFADAYFAVFMKLGAFLRARQEKRRAMDVEAGAMSVSSRSKAFVQ
jgi:hypothetical protein